MIISLKNPGIECTLRCDLLIFSLYSIGFGMPNWLHITLNSSTDELNGRDIEARNSANFCTSGIYSRRTE